MSQEKAIELIESGKNVFISGQGGVGKSYVINKVKTPSTLLVAPTGIAALNIGGITCHRAFALPFERFDESEYKRKIKPLADLFGKGVITRVIIDECGMLRSDLLDLIDHRLKRATGNLDKPFGGVQVVVVGDFYQLEPIVTQADQDDFYSKYKTAFAFGAKCWNFEMVELTKVYRQSDEHQISLLSAVRRKLPNYEQALQEISSMAKGSSTDCLHLSFFKADADKINKEYYQSVIGKQYSYKAYSMGTWTFNEKPVDDCINLKKGVRVLLCANNPNKGYVNGDRGVVTQLYPNAVTVLLDSGDEVDVERFEWVKYSYEVKGKKLHKKEAGTFTQLPIKLGWAVVVHRTQGMTLDNVSIDVGRGSFAHGQTYVALSRIRNLANLHLARPLKPSDIIVREEVKDFYDGKY